MKKCMRESFMRILTYKQAVREALKQAMEKDSRVYVFGEGVDDAKGFLGTSLDLQKEFGKERVFDIPLAENGLTGVAIGSAIAGMRPVMVHQRADFMLLSMDQIVNHAAKWNYMFGGKVSVPLVIRAIVGRGGGQGAQHSQSMHSTFAHFPGLKVVMPSTPYDVKGLLLESIYDNNPVIFIEHKGLYDTKGDVPKKMYTIPIGKGKVIKEGKDVTIVAISYMNIESLEAAKILEKEGINVEIIDLRTVSPFDDELILESVKKTGRLVIADLDWQICSIGSEISAKINEKGFKFLKAPIMRVGLKHTPTPASYILEEVFYPNKKDIVSAVKKTLEH